MRNISIWCILVYLTPLKLKLIFPFFQPFKHPKFMRSFKKILQAILEKMHLPTDILTYFHTDSGEIIEPFLPFPPKGGGPKMRNISIWSILVYLPPLKLTETHFLICSHTSLLIWHQLFRELQYYSPHCTLC